MINFYESIKANPTIRKIGVDNQLFAEYICPIGEPLFPIWTQHDYVVHVISGKKAWHTTGGVKWLSPGETIYIKKGAHIIQQSYEATFCVLLFFVKDDFKRQILKDPALQSFVGFPRDDRSFIEIRDTPALLGFYQSVLAYFYQSIPPTDTIVELKMREFVHLLSQSAGNEMVLKHILSVERDSKAHLKDVMLQNYQYNLKISDYATLCNRSISSFKRDFQDCFGSSPGKWLAEMRLKHAASLLLTTEASISEIGFSCGFEDVSHFSKSFRKFYRCTPRDYRKVHLNRD